MVTTQSNFFGNITKEYALGEIDSRLPYITEIVPCDNTTEFFAGDVLNYDAANNEYVRAGAAAVVTNTVVCLENKATTTPRANVLITGVVCIKTTTVLIELDECKYDAAGTVAKWVSGVDAANLKARIQYKKIAHLIHEGLGKSPVTNAGTTDPNNRILAWVNPPHI
jgi:hypothetical protein